MRASPSVRLPVAASSRWRLAVASWGALLVLVLAYWAIESAPLTGLWVWPVALGAGSMGAGVAWQLLSFPPVVLGWDGQTWRCVTAGIDINDAPPGALQVCLDLGGWMLVRHLPEGQRKGCWIPVQRRLDDPTWHLFRCAVYSARAEVGGHPHDSLSGASKRSDPAA